MAEIVEFKHPAELEALVAVELFDRPRREGWSEKYAIMGAEEDYGGEPVWLNRNGHAITCAAFARSPDAAFEEVVPWLVSRGFLPQVETYRDREHGQAFRCIFWNEDGFPYYDVMDIRHWPNVATAICVAALTLVRRRKIPPSEK